ncbi:MAG: methyltransferase domain-containing protein [Anaerolineaceae bacterium]|nr:methyltransferase domain-containing protein [Anaerolineaceae bacterium]
MKSEKWEAGERASNLQSPISNLQLSQVAAAFSRKAGVYDAFGQDHTNLTRMRQKVYAQVARWTPPGSHILELNAGTGLDAVALVERGYRVHATDIAPGMVAEMARKKEMLGLDGRFTPQLCSFTELDKVEGGPFDAIFSNFGGLNCVADLTAVTRHLPHLLKPGGVLTWVIMPPVCPWELALLAKDWRVATRRLRRGGVVANVEGIQFRTFYFTPGQVQQALGPDFHLLELSGLSIVTPTADNDRFARRHPRLFGWLVQLDDWLAERPLFNRIGDFFVLTVRFDPHPGPPPLRGREPSFASQGENQGGSQFTFACPVCRGPLEWETAEAVRCPVDGLTFACEAGIWRFLPPERAAALAQFRQEYETVRRSEGRGSEDSAFYQALPFVGKDRTQINTDSTDFTGRSLRASRLKSGWEERARSFGVLIGRVVRPLEQRLKRPLHILDLGAGNGWLANRLAARGHVVAAVDLGVNDWDGLGVRRHYETEFVCLQAEFDQLPLDAGQADLVIFNAAFHYSVDYVVTLREARRVLRPGGQVVVLDTAVYQHPSSGQQMVAEREATFLQQLGFASNTLPSENFLTPARLKQLATELGLRWHKIETVPGWRRWVRAVKVALRRQREPAQFPIIVLATEDTEIVEK